VIVPPRVALSFFGAFEALTSKAPGSAGGYLPDALLDKLRSNLQEVRARGGQLYVLTDAQSHFNATEGVRVLRLPADYGELSPIAQVLPLQMLRLSRRLVKSPTTGSDIMMPCTSHRRWPAVPNYLSRRTTNC
jgi:hypothetical protein